MACSQVNFVVDQNYSQTKYVIDSNHVSPEGYAF